MIIMHYSLLSIIIAQLIVIVILLNFTYIYIYILLFFFLLFKYNDVYIYCI